MSDDLVKRLRKHIAVYFDDRGHVFEDDTLCDDAADRIEELEAKLAKAAEALEAIVVDDTWGLEHDVYMICRATLAELKEGEKK